MTPEMTILKICLGLKSSESCLIIADEKKIDIAESIFKKAKAFADAELLKIPEGDFNGQEPPSWAAEKMLGFDVIIFVTSKSLSWTEARIRATEKGARIASMPGITYEIMQRAIDVNYEYMGKITNKLADILDSGKKVKVTTKAGTNIDFDINGRSAYGRNVGVFHNPGDWGNLPGAEAFIAPVEKTANGAYVVDASQAGIGKLKNPITIKVENGFAVKVQGKEEAKDFKKVIESIEDNNAYNIAEFGIGTNPKAIVSGIVLEDEKVKGTAHIALGKNSGFGGEIDVPFHVDGVFNSPTIFVDDKLIMEDGNLL